VLCVRTAIVDKLITRWQIEEPLVISVNQTSKDEILRIVREFLTTQETAAL
jgi:hypothetical protein